jgi:hypothetical protein
MPPTGERIFGFLRANVALMYPLHFCNEWSIHSSGMPTMARPVSNQPVTLIIFATSLKWYVM